MRRTLCKSKIHRATVTDANLAYEGSITLDPVLMEAADLLEYEHVHVVDINNGARFETYVIKGADGSGDVVLNGAAARLVQPGDRVIIMSYASYDTAELEGFAPRIVFVDDANRILDRGNRERSQHQLRVEQK
jgi:aspartate 1-decarboxylase